MKQDPMNEWMLRDELLAAFHRWPIIVLFCLVGTVLGLAFAYLWPSTYRANVELSVELNSYRVLDDQYIPAFAGAEFRNIDDYKHWQMLQLSIVVLSDPYMQETLSRLREINPEWSSVSEQDLREMLSANWRNAGVWHLVAKGSSSTQAIEAVEAWRDVVIELTRVAIATSRGLFRLELVLRSLNDELVENQLNQSALEALHVDIDEILVKLNTLSSDEELPGSHHQEMFTITNKLSGLLPGGQSLINEFPQENTPASAYIDWSERLKIIIEGELSTIDLRIAVLRDEISQVSAEWEENLREASGLSATLNLENRQGANTRVEEVRTYSLAAMIGALLGLLAWIMVFLVQVNRKGYR
jgi:hypothetical protein